MSEPRSQGMVKPKLKYADVPLTRAGERRKDSEWLLEQQESSESRVVPVWRDRSMINDMGPNPRSTHMLCGGDVTKRVLGTGAETVFLGLQENQAVFAVDISSYSEEQAVAMVEGGSFVDLRRIGPSIDAPGAALMAYARGMLYWHRQNSFCSRCGHTTESLDGGHRRKCQSPECNTMAFPRTDPAVIMLVEYWPHCGRSPMCLLGNHYRLPTNVYSTLAGFVEPGESLEETVVREVYEEVGVRISSACYQASQPWPFPSSIMLGYRAHAESTEIVVDRKELKDARWFTVEEVRGFGEWGDESVPYSLPRKDSIARFLVDSWVSEVSAP